LPTRARWRDAGRVQTPPDSNANRRSHLQSVRERLAGLPISDPREALLNCFAQALHTLGRPELAQLRRRVVDNFGPAHPFVDIIDGHVALRDIRER
jgi:hypothetical protein